MGAFGSRRVGRIALMASVAGVVAISLGVGAFAIVVQSPNVLRQGEPTNVASDQITEPSGPQPVTWDDSQPFILPSSEFSRTVARSFDPLERSVRPCAIFGLAKSSLPLERWAWLRGW
jgi:hypothetical protein